MFRPTLYAIGLSLCVPALAGPLHDAAGNGDVEMVRELVAEGVDVNQVDTMVGTPLTKAAMAGEAEAVRVLIEAGADVNLKGGMIGLTPLQAAVYSSPEVTGMLLDAGADVAVRDGSGNTLLHLAAEGGQMEIVKLLLAFGADVSATNNQGREPIEFAGASAHFEVVDLLLENGALPPVPIEPVSGLLATADPERGQVLYRDRGCLRCHDASADGHDKDEGPNLWGIVGRAKASGTFLYSDALQRVGGVWSYEDLNAWLYEPKRFAPGNKMNLRHLAIVGSQGTPEVQDRADLIAFLRLRSDDPVPLP
ncbi:MAG: ankyrin repeat domain-containing protein [Bauldia sp.]|uniref:ankyrin repeat domain-containing protein n=1 Tax=Bauldia sp. TaxID=2575872 RepID=UPI001DBB407C|nr:ankyrin repeat domain-containing protein [Bauldia sp.]MCB1495032.1 ankyrin repeat domain-containing protein [Bauldia sp.]